MKKLIYSLTIIIVIFSCKSKDSKIQTHPQVENFPYLISKEVIKVETPIERKVSKTFNELDLAKLSIENKSPVLLGTFELPDADVSRIHFESLNEERFVILSKSSSIFLEMNVLENEWKEIAKYGKGPGEIYFPTDLYQVENKLYISSKNYRVTIYECSNNQNCKFNKTIQVDRLQPNALISDPSNKKIILLGLTSEISKNQINEFGEIKSLHQIGMDGELLASYGEYYNVNNEWMLLQPFENGYLEKVTFNNKDVLVKAFDLFPSVMVFENQELVKRYEFNNFMISKRDFNTETKELFINLEDWSLINGIKEVDDKKIVVQIRNLKDRKVDEYGASWTQTEDIYLIDLESDEVKFIGTYDLNGFQIKFSRKHILVVENDNMKLFEY